ncbi:hypothetical protein V1264_008484 [Littorina saxatilis]|uniref:Uncharacterized protein n=1 Tax=Littorina saxatilis TaxID=31220 RepID=A0AAN9G2W2_9CAEN
MNKGERKWPLYVGAVTEYPDSLTVPRVAWGWESAVVVYTSNFTDRGNTVTDGTSRQDHTRKGKNTNSDIGKALENLPLYSRVGVGLDTSRRLHLHVNGADQGIVPHLSLSGPCWAMWQLTDDKSEFKTLPVTYFQYPDPMTHVW